MPRASQAIHDLTLDICVCFFTHSGRSASLMFPSAKSNVFDRENRLISQSKCNRACSFDWLQKIWLQHFFKTQMQPCPITFTVFEAISPPKWSRDVYQNTCCLPYTGDAQFWLCVTSITWHVTSVTHQRTWDMAFLLATTTVWYILYCKYVIKSISNHPIRTVF